MPKDEFDFDDPLELNGVAIYTEEDTSRDTAECFVEEFMMLGYNHKQLLALFRNPHYLGMNIVLQNKGEPFVKEVIAETFAKWGKKIVWPDLSAEVHAPASPPSTIVGHESNRKPVGGSCGCGCSSTPPAGQTISLDERLTDPMGNPIPKLQ